MEQQRQDKRHESRCCPYQTKTSATTQKATCNLTVCRRVASLGHSLSPDYITLWTNFLPQRAMRGAEPTVGSEAKMVWLVASCLSVKRVSKLHQLRENRKILKNRKMSMRESILQKYEHWLCARRCPQCRACREGQGAVLVLKEVTLEKGRHGNTPCIGIWAVTNVKTEHKHI